MAARDSVTTTMDKVVKITITEDMVVSNNSNPITLPLVSMITEEATEAIRMEDVTMVITSKIKEAINKEVAKMGTVEDSI